jgi:hypothetical protein
MTLANVFTVQTLISARCNMYFSNRPKTHGCCSCLLLQETGNNADYDDAVREIKLKCNTCVTTPSAWLPGMIILSGCHGSQMDAFLLVSKFRLKQKRFLIC